MERFFMENLKTSKKRFKNDRNLTHDQPFPSDRNASSKIQIRTIKKPVDI